MGPLHGPTHDINLCKVVQSEVKAMKLSWLTARGSGAGCVRFQGTMKRPAKGEELNALVTNALKEIIKSNRRLKYKAEKNSGSEEEQERFNFEDLNIGK